MNSDTLQRILAATAAIRSVLDESSGGWANESAKQQIHRQLSTLQYIGPSDPYFREKVNRLPDWIDVLYSARKHERHGGVERVRGFILQDLSNIESRAQTLGAPAADSGENL